MGADDDLEWEARKEAERVLGKHQLGKLPIDPFRIAELEEILVEPKPAEPGVSGMLCRVGDAFGILYATEIDNDGFKRFSVAHELGHYFLPGHIDALLADGHDIHESHAGSFTGDRYERQADHFAANLLMPRRLFAAAVLKAGDGLTAIESLAALCETSLTSTAIRYARCVEVPAAVVISTRGRIEFCFMSPALAEVRGLTWIRKGMPVPSGTATHALSMNAGRVERCERADYTSDLQTWFDGQRNVEMTEEVIGLGQYGKTLTVLYASAGIDEDEDDEDDDEAGDDWGEPRFRRSRRR